MHPEEIKNLSISLILAAKKVDELESMSRQPKIYFSDFFLFGGKSMFGKLGSTTIIDSDTLANHSP